LLLLLSSSANILLSKKLGEVGENVLAFVRFKREEMNAFRANLFHLQLHKRPAVNMG
jgi:hypothetical protein